MLRCPHSANFAIIAERTVAYQSAKIFYDVHSPTMQPTLVAIADRCLSARCARSAVTWCCVLVISVFVVVIVISKFISCEREGDVCYPSQ